MVVTVARKYGNKAIGNDLDRKLVELSRKSVSLPLA
jgi:hypothetical protein